MSANDKLEATFGRVDPQERELANEIAMHHRLDPMTSQDRCTCGDKTPLGHMFTEHIAADLIRQGWRKS